MEDFVEDGSGDGSGEGIEVRDYVLGECGVVAAEEDGAGD